MGERRGRLGTVGGINASALHFPSDHQGGVTTVPGDSAVKAWTYGELRGVMIASLTSDITVLVRDEADTKTLATLRIQSGGNQPRFFPLVIPLSEPWGINPQSNLVSLQFHYEMIG